MAALVAGFKIARTVVAQPAMRPFVVREVHPGTAIATDAENIRKNGATDLHIVGTCRMGRDSSVWVVDPRLKVHGFEGLRVVECLIMPSVTSGNANGPALMIGEKAADMILADAHP